jgi:large subunit ribosomal protein L4
MSKLNVYTSKGTQKTSMSLPKKFSEQENMVLLAQAIRVYEDKLHLGLSKTKTRGEVTLSKRKAWRQKGTGRARHGARSAPIFVGGGVTHGPKGVKAKLSLPKKMRRKALGVALSIKAKNGEVLVVDGLSSLKKTKEAAVLFDNISKKEKLKKDKRMTVALSDTNLGAKLALRNLKNVEVIRFSDINAHTAYFSGVLVVDKDALNTKSSKVQKEK